MKQMPFLSATAVIIFAIAVGAYSLSDPRRIDKPGFDHPRRPVALFDHDEHNEIAGLDDDCSVCHHVYDGKIKIEGESSEDLYCSDCHSLTPTRENTVGLREAFHRQCRTCHLDAGKGPLLCGQCHPNPSRPVKGNQNE